MKAENKMEKKVATNMKNLGDRGQLTLDFMFALILITGISALLGALTFALTLTEVVQYVAYSSARTFLAADLHQDDQTNAADQKSQQLLKSLPFLSGAEKSGWIVIKSNGAKDYTSYAQNVGVDYSNSLQTQHNQFMGVQFALQLPILKLRIPVIGDVVQPPNGNDQVTTNVSSFLMREPTFDECRTYLNGVYPALIQKGQGAYQAAEGAEGAYQGFFDNGC